MVTIRDETFSDLCAREELLDRVWGPWRFQKTAERLREGRKPAEGLSLVAEEGQGPVGTIRFWHVSAGPERPALLLGPLAVDEAWRGRGIGAALVQHAIATARWRGHLAVLLVGDAAYYRRFGFSVEKTGALWLPGPFERHRLLGCEIVPGTLDGARGLVSAIDRTAPMPSVETFLEGRGSTGTSARQVSVTVTRIAEGTTTSTHIPHISVRTY
jgi:predicted N-acetyltransferase YhbS